MNSGGFTHDGTFILISTDHGVIVRRSREEAGAELRRRQNASLPVKFWSPWERERTDDPWRVPA